MTTIKTFLTVLVFCLTAFSFPALSVAEEASDDIGSLVSGNTAFALDLYTKLKETDGNLFFSPAGISTALAMTYGGARGNTALQMAQTLHFTLGQDKLHSTFSTLENTLNAVQEEGDVTLYTVNSIWPQKGYPFREDYLSLIRKNYGVSITPVDFERLPEKARRTINRWTEEKTKNKIKELIRVGDLEPSMVLVLVIAIYFNGSWAYRFDGTETSRVKFFLPDGGEKDVQMMYQKGKFGYKEVEQVQVLELPYSGKDLSFFAILPRTADDFVRIENNLTKKNVQSWVTDLPKKRVEVFLPKFKIAWGTVDLKKSLTSLGMRDPFIETTADFSGMTGAKDLFIFKVLHKTVIDVNEEGTEAAAAISVFMGKGPRIPAFRADHPFIFLIRDNNTGSILFLGRIVDPM